MTKGLLEALFSGVPIRSSIWDRFGRREGPKTDPRTALGGAQEGSKRASKIDPKNESKMDPKLDPKWTDFSMVSVTHDVRHDCF